jgi:hypothetical protein
MNARLLQIFWRSLLFLRKIYSPFQFGHILDGGNRHLTELFDFDMMCLILLMPKFLNPQQSIATLVKRLNYGFVVGKIVSCNGCKDLIFPVSLNFN